VSLLQLAVQAVTINWPRLLSIRYTDLQTPGMTNGGKKAIRGLLVQILVALREAVDDPIVRN
jgi:hypothetical protein